ncbi:MAG: hypothetical protein ACRDRH_25575 [Pseudonocardia sp.]
MSDSVGLLRYPRFGEIVRWNLGIVLLMLALLALVPGIAIAKTTPFDLLLTTQDLPEGFVVQDEAVLPPADRVLTTLSCAEDQRFLGATVGRRVWGNGSVAVIDMAVQTITDNAAAALLRRLVDCVSASPAFVVKGVPGAVGRVGDTVVEDTQVDVHEVVFRRGSWTFIVMTIQPRPASDGLIQGLSAAQAARASLGSSEPAPAPDRARSIGALSGSFLFFLVIYPALMDWFGNRMRRSNQRMIVRSHFVRPDQIVDVSPRAQETMRQALSLFMLEFGVLQAIVSGTMFALFVSPVGGGITLAVAGGGIVLVRWLRRRTGTGYSVTRLRRSISVMVLVVIAVGVAVLGLVLLLTGALAANRSPGDQELRDGTEALDLTIMSYVGLMVLGLSVVLYRLARRISTSRPSCAVLADQRPPVLYLRSFADDRLNLRVAPFARPSLLERLSARRKQGFEEIIAEELQQYGPLSAVGEPGRRLAPIGFAREYLTDVDWQSRVQQRMSQSTAIVVTVGRSRGLEWEIQELIRTSSWRKVIFVFPPVGATEILNRWEKLEPLLETSGLRGVGLPVDSSCLLAITFTAEAECRYYCATYPNAWSYKAAMAVALADLGLTPSHERPEYVAGQSGSASEVAPARAGVPRPAHPEPTTAGPFSGRGS